MNAFTKFSFDLTMILLLINFFCRKKWKIFGKKRTTKNYDDSISKLFIAWYLFILFCLLFTSSHFNIFGNEKKNMYSSFICPFFSFNVDKLKKHTHIHKVLNLWKIKNQTICVVFLFVHSLQSETVMQNVYKMLIKFHNTINIYSVQ